MVISPWVLIVARRERQENEGECVMLHGNNEVMVGRNRCHGGKEPRPAASVRFWELWGCQAGDILTHCMCREI